MTGITSIGAMDEVIVRGLIAAGAVPDKLVVYPANVGVSARFVRETGTKLVYSNVGLVEWAGDDAIVVMTIKPFVVGGALNKIRKAAAKRESVVVSVAAETSIEFLESRLEPGQPVVRTIPNMAAAIGASVTICACNPTTTSRTDDVADTLALIGIAEPMAGNDFLAFSAITGCSSASTFGYIDATAGAVVKNRLPKVSATRIAAQVVCGVARLSLARLDDGAGTASLADVTQSLGGAAVVGMMELERAGSGAVMIRGVQAFIGRDKGLFG